MKKYLLSSDMIPLEELKKTKKYQVIKKGQSSSIFNSTQVISSEADNLKSSDGTTAGSLGLPPKSPAKGKLRIQNWSVMNDVLSYRGVPGFRDELVERKVTN